MTSNESSQLSVLSSNLKRNTGHTYADVMDMIIKADPDVVFLQEATADFLQIQNELGGVATWTQIRTRPDGLLTWSRKTYPHVRGSITHKSTNIPARYIAVKTEHGMLINIHLSHHQKKNRHELSTMMRLENQPTALIGDTNMIGRIPKAPKNRNYPYEQWVDHKMPTTFRIFGWIPVRLDRCVTKNWQVIERTRLPAGKSDHNPILIRLSTT